MGMREIQNTARMVELYDDVFTADCQWIFVEEVAEGDPCETLKVRWSDGNHVHEFEANQAEFICTCLEESDQYPLGK